MSSAIRSLKLIFLFFKVNLQHEGNAVEFDLKENEFLHPNTIPIKRVTTQDSAEEYQPTNVRCNVNKRVFFILYVGNICSKRTPQPCPNIASLCKSLIDFNYNKIYSAVKNCRRILIVYTWKYEIQRKTFSLNLYCCINFLNVVAYALISNHQNT